MWNAATPAFACYPLSFHREKALKPQRSPCFVSFLFPSSPGSLSPVKEMANWSNLPRDAVEAISKRLDNGADYVRFRSVCTSWRSSLPKKPQFPWLVVMYTGEDGKTAVGLYDFPKPQFFRSQLPDGISKDNFFCGSSRGWICVLDSAPSVSLHNPFTGAQIQLPPFTDFPISSRGFRLAKVDEGFLMDDAKYEFDSLGTYLAKKVILSSDPVAAPNDCVVMGLMYLGERLIFLLPGGDYWTVSRPFPPNFFEDVIFYKGRFYAVSKKRVFVCDPSTNAEVIEIPSADPPLTVGRASRYVSLNRITQSYLVESSGDLLLVTATEVHDPPSYTCEVYQVDLSGGRLKLLKLKNLDGRSLFLGINSMSVSVGNAPGCKANHIYSITLSSTKEQFRIEGRDVPGIRLENNIVVSNMEDGDTSFISTLSDDTHGNWWSAYWLTPNLCY